MSRLVWILLPVVIIAAAVWWLLLDSRAPASAEGAFDIAAWRSATAGDDNLPLEIRVEFIGTDVAKAYAVETGAGFGDFPLAYPAFEIVLPDQTIVVGGAVDRETAASLTQSKTEATFDEAAFARLLNAISNADQILITHEHLDHVMAITRHPTPAAFADRLVLTAPQIAALPRFAPEGGLDPALKSLRPFALPGPTRIAPGVVVAPAPGHTVGNQVIYIRAAGGAEYLMVGDIVWAMSNIENLKTRPRVLQYFFFDPQEDRAAILRQVRALHDLAEAEPDLIILPEHDRAWLDTLVAKGVLVRGLK